MSTTDSTTIANKRYRTHALDDAVQKFLLEGEAADVRLQLDRLEVLFSQTERAVLMDGKDVTNTIQAIEIRITAGELPTFTIHGIAYKPTA